MIVASFGRGGGGGGGGGERMCVPWDSSALSSNDESSHISEGKNCYATEPSC